MVFSDVGAAAWYSVGSGDATGNRADTENGPIWAGRIRSIYGSPTGGAPDALGRVGEDARVRYATLVFADGP